MKTPIGMEIFTGFNIQYPEYEIITPQSGRRYTLRTMTVGEEEILKGSMMTPITVADHLAQVIWKCIVKRPDDIKSYEDFINKTTLKDRDALIIGLHLISYGDIEKYSVVCDQCDYNNLVNVNIAESMNFVAWDKFDENNELVDCISHRHTLPLAVFKGVNAILKIPTMAEEIELNKKAQYMSDKTTSAMMNLLMIDKFTVDATPKNPNGDSLTDRNVILSAYNSLPAKDKALINKTYQDEYDKYKAVVEVTIRCGQCGKERKVLIDLTQQFFRSLYQ